MTTEILSVPLQKLQHADSTDYQFPFSTSYLITNKMEIHAFDFTENGNLMSQLVML
jgi:hypothetical protein